MLRFLCQLIDLYTYLICIYVLLSWFPGVQQHKMFGQVYSAMGQLVEPLLGLIRSALPRAPFDYSPIVAVLGLSVLTRFLLYL